MPAYNFKKQFAPMVESGAKRQTIRQPRKRQTKPGETLYLYMGMRTKKCRKLRQEICTDVKKIEIRSDSICIDGCALTIGQIEPFAIADGFNDVMSFFAFFAHQYKGAINFELITW